MSSTFIQFIFCIKSEISSPCGREWQNFSNGSFKNIPALGNLIRSGNWQQVYSTMETQSKEGMMTMEQHLLHLYQHGIISKESAITYTNEASLIERLG